MHFVCHTIVSCNSLKRNKRTLKNALYMCYGIVATIDKASNYINPICWYVYTESHANSVFPFCLRLNLKTLLVGKALFCIVSHLLLALYIRISVSLSLRPGMCICIRRLCSKHCVFRCFVYGIIQLKIYTNRESKRYIQQ